MRRFLILALFVLASSWWGAAMLRRLADVRAERTLATVAVRPGVGQAVAAVRGAARRRGVTLVQAGVAGTGTDVVMQGPERAMRLALSDLEGVRPAVRFLSWRLRPEPGSADRLRFEGVALVTPR